MPLLSIQQLQKSFAQSHILQGIDLDVEQGEVVVILGPSGCGKSTLLRVIGGIDYADSGKVITNQTISWPVALSGGFQGSLTARQNVRFVARLYVNSHEEVEHVVNFVEEFAEIGKYFDMPMKSYSSGMRSRIGFGLSMAFNFDYYLLDEAGAVGDASFRKKSQALLDELKENSNIIMVSHDLKDLTRNCDVAFLVRDGKAEYFDNVQDAVEVYKAYAS